MAMLLSVIIPVYNVEKYLAECLDSVCSQTLKDIEIICIDDGSTDSSLEILKEAAAKDPRLRILRQQNKGAGAARNCGIREARGRYLFFADADDRLALDLLERTVRRAEEADADVVAFGFRRFNADGMQGRQLGYQGQWLKPGQTIFSRADCPDHILRMTYPAPWNKLFARRFVLDAGLRFDEISSSNDISFSAVASFKARRTAVLNETLYFHRIGHGGTITSTKQKNLDNVLLAAQSAIRQVKAADSSAATHRAICFFEAEVYTATFSSFIHDWNANKTQAFYTAVHARFNEGECADYAEILKSAHGLLFRYQILKRYAYDEVSVQLRRELLDFKALPGVPRLLRPFVHLFLDHISPSFKAKIKRFLRRQ